ncbi:hypothetical protein L1987_28146 [Smallanthus sonchifolius]|uniref:Uncharacterized protein n=1 Tax=Smallanthus sonchifolius TaxID=185202 RepID=A0ACB9IBJ4_9ASTR|nr:hypothetical protein L1987_28146 [Smallanthus sonchifolius]
MINRLLPLRPRTHDTLTVKRISWLDSTDMGKEKKGYITFISLMERYIKFLIYYNFSYYAFSLTLFHTTTRVFPTVPPPFKSIHRRHSIQ